jgi:hypothetical protein
MCILSARHQLSAFVCMLSASEKSILLVDTWHQHGGRTHPPTRMHARAAQSSRTEPGTSCVSTAVDGGAPRTYSALHAWPACANHSNPQGNSVCNVTTASTTHTRYVGHPSVSILMIWKMRITAAIGPGASSAGLACTIPPYSDSVYGTNTSSSSMLFLCSCDAWRGSDAKGGTEPARAAKQMRSRVRRVRSVVMAKIVEVRGGGRE